MECRYTAVVNAPVKDSFLFLDIICEGNKMVPPTCWSHSPFLLLKKKKKSVIGFLFIIFVCFPNYLIALLFLSVARSTLCCLPAGMCAYRQFYIH
ncbi:hypothetical protein VNO77_29568 [Canavalia gladiata]|uniref:Uncharacterized protein n=1 Tax=Canavalia gladiata TaxID=3824 RepID=A0AAN9Q3W9_CANGL